MYSTDVSSAAGSRASRTVALALPAFTTAIFASAFLLFAIQPMFAKMVLPRLGGSPSVWSVAMCFFQAALLVGYAYAHLLTRYLPLMTAVVVHVGLSLVALVALPIGLAVGWDRPPLEYQAIWLIGLFAVSIGVPFVAVSANSPLLQAWFARTGHPHAADPYFLYGASNIGSLVALLGYPILFEPFLRLQTQSVGWTIGYIVLIGMIAGCGALAVASDKIGAFHPQAVAPSSARDSAVGWPKRLSWVGYAFIPSALLVALTVHISTDVAAAPFLWVIPLALFLLTFVITFARRPLIPHSFMLLVQPIFVLVLAILSQVGQEKAWGLFLILNLVGYFVVAMTCHGELVRKRPAASQLTQFYLWMSVGGVLGGIFVSLIAPHIFSTVIEYPVLLVLSLLVRPGVFSEGTRKWAHAIGIGVLVYAVLVLPKALLGYNLALSQTGIYLLAVLLVSLVAALVVKSPSLVVTLVAGVFAAGLILQQNLSVIESKRGFFGVHKVSLSRDGRFRLLFHGTTLHGAQRILEDDGSPAKTLEPLTYFHGQSPLHDTIEATRQAHGGLQKVGIVGLGSGSLACWHEPGEDWRYWEIDPLVADIAKDPQYFSFLSTCTPNIPIIFGDARLTIADEPDGVYDLIINDAFSSDTMPAHLMTREAIQMYLDKTKPNGVVAMHISNRNMDLAPALAATTQAMGVPALIHEPVFAEPMEKNFKSASRVVVLARDEASLAPIAALNGWKPLKPIDGTSAWTDDYSNVVGAIIAHWRSGQSYR